MADRHAPDSLKYQWRLYALVSRSTWATGLDKSIAYEIIDNYYPKFGNARASLRYLQQATCAERPNVIASIRRLVENGPFSIARKGAGTRPTEFNLHFDMVAEKPSGIADNTTNSDSSSGIAGDTSCGIADDTSSAPSGIADDTKTDLREPAYRAELQVGGEIDTPDPLPAVGLPATAAVSRAPESAFDRFWRSFPRKYQKPKARAVWDKLSPNSELAERIIVAAAAWTAHYEANPVEKKWMPAPANWLAGERYDEDMPSVYADPKEAAIAKKRDRLAKAEPSKPKPFTERRETFTIIEASVSIQEGAQWLDVELQADDGTMDDMSICIESPNESAQEKGQNLLNRIVSATGLPTADDSSDLVGAKFVRVLRSKFAEFEYEPVPANENRQPFSDTVIVYDMPLPTKVRQPAPSFADIVARTRFEGWASKIGTDYDDMEEAA